MATSSKKMISNSIVYAIGGILIKCFNFFLVPLYTTVLSTEDYGIINLSNTFLGVMSYVAAFSLYSAILRFFVDLKDDPEKLKRFYGTMVVFITVTCAVLAGLLTIFREPVREYIFSGAPFFPIVFVIILTLLFKCLHLVYGTILRSQQKALKSSILSFAYFIATVLLNIIFVVTLKMGAIGSLLATLIASVAYTVYFIVDMLCTKQITFCLDWELLKSALKYSIPIMPHNLSTHIAVFVSSVLIGNVATLSSLGVYSVAAQFGNIADTVQNYVNSAYGPWLFEKLHDKDQGYKKELRKTVKFMASVIGFFFVGIALFAHDYVVLMVDEKFVDAWKYVPMIVMVFAIKTMYYFYVNVLFYYKKAARLLFIATLSGSILNVILSAVFIPMFSVVGSILADAVSMIVRVGIVVIICKQFEDIGLKIRDFVANVLIVGAFAAVGLIFSYTKCPTTFEFWEFFYRVGIVVLYMGYMVLVYRKQFMALVKRIKAKRSKSNV